MPPLVEQASISPSYAQAQASVSVGNGGQGNGEDQIPVGLPSGRRAWLVIPTPFHTSDKDRLKAQIDLLLMVEDEEYPD